MRGKNYSKTEMEFGRDLFKQGYTTGEIAEKVGRPTSAVRKWVKDLRTKERTEERTRMTKYDIGLTDRVWSCLTESCDKDGNVIVTNGEIAKAINGSLGSIGGVLNRLKEKGYISVKKTFDDTGLSIIRTIHVNKPYENEKDEEGVDKIKTVSEPEDKWETLYRQLDALISITKAMAGKQAKIEEAVTEIKESL